LRCEKLMAVLISPSAAGTTVVHEQYWDGNYFYIDLHIHCVRGRTMQIQHRISAGANLPRLGEGSMTSLECCTNLLSDMD
jgi:hypothetical protein